MRVLLVSIFLDSLGRATVRRGVAIATEALFARLTERGHHVHIETPDSLPTSDAVRGEWDCVFWAALYPHTESTLYSVPARRIFVMRHGTESLHEVGGEHFARDPRMTLLFASRASRHKTYGADVISSDVLYPCLYVPKNIDLGEPLTYRFLNAFEACKGTSRAIALAHMRPLAAFDFHDHIKRGVPLSREAWDLPANVVVRPPTDNPAEVWKNTRALLLPSWWETFSLAAYEASYYGIPTILRHTYSDDPLSEWLSPPRSSHSSTPDFLSSRAKQAHKNACDQLSRLLDSVSGYPMRVVA